MFEFDDLSALDFYEVSMWVGTQVKCYNCHVVQWIHFGRISGGCCSCKKAVFLSMDLYYKHEQGPYRVPSREW